ncbi:hypothetical protein RQP46_007554 [Phenoliferia psychrophenolica]
MPPKAPQKPPIIPQAELEKQLASLKIDLAPDSPGKARARLRDVCEWAADHCADITIDVLNAVPGGSYGVPIFKVVLAVAMLGRDARDATAACDGLRERLCDIYEQSYQLRQHKAERIDEKMDEIFSTFMKHIPKWRKGLKKDATLDLVNGLTDKIKALQDGYNMPALRGIAADVRKFTLANIPQDSPHPPIPATPSSFGRDGAVAKVVGLLSPNARGVTEHAVLVGVGGIGKTTLSQQIVRDPRVAQLGPPTFIRCQLVSTLLGFQQELLCLRTEALRPSEDLGNSVQNLLHMEPRFLVLDNLFDSPSTTPDDFLPYLSLLADIPNVTFLITTRNGDLAKATSSRRIQRFNVPGLADDPAEELFRDEFGREPSSYSLPPNSPDLLELLRLLGGIPLAIILVAARARSEPSLRDVVQLWKDGQAWDSGTLVPNRQNSVDVSLALSFDDKSLESADAINLLYVLADSAYGITALHGASGVGHLKVADLLLKAGAAVDAKSNYGETSLFRASVEGHLEVVDLLLKAGAAVDVKTDDGRIALCEASCQGYLEIVERLLKAGAAVDAETDQGKTALILASEIGHLEVVDRLLNAGAAVDAKMDGGKTALHRAAWHGHLKVIDCLLKAGAVVNAQTDHCETALHVASLAGKKSTVVALLNAGADPSLKTNGGETALDLARKEDYPEVIEMLERWSPPSPPVPAIPKDAHSSKSLQIKTHYTALKARFHKPGGSSQGPSSGGAAVTAGPAATT